MGQEAVKAPAAAPTRQDLLVSLITQLQSDHDLAVKAGNVSAAVTASKAIADLLSVKDETSRANTNPYADVDDATLDAMIRQMTASLRASGGGHLLDGDGEDGGSGTNSGPSRRGEDELAARILALLERSP
ncbi:MAG: hypothetical protein E5X53_12470 [Mesorhizobium sp.]|uniref:hypothetical protein n=1 Tax=Mesorhizobium sp. TaxID=1871066 RepID=UPI001218E96B|nr:hypothetical protein [Mesorhizobium sp.]TIP74848.1 MAG: hypothetical protein E5X55_07840 [Mesorhizobium sp.]TIQ14640.1 MAG: hypothetical protein E5X57_04075 [Mesorhizobium sp.]TIR52177.1 MAG: hypothetical protein E5X53_12470 [Mesorhizobium sp.]TJV96267.1 MAG: hypothetical protein E5X52_19650 [Mesorhizobium sp.]